MKKIILEQCDCLVVGGGTAGVVAAIQAARAGVKVILLEMNPQLGGTMTVGKVSSPAYFFAGGRQLIAGIGWELVREAILLSGGKLPDPQAASDRKRPGIGVYVDPNIYPLVAEEKCLEAGVKLHYQEILTDLHPLPNGWEAEAAGSGIIRKITAREVIDCSGNATAVRLAGGSCIRERQLQPGTLEFFLGGYDLKDLDADELEKAYQKALADGELRKGDYCYPDRPLFYYLRCRGYNLQHIFQTGGPSETPDPDIQTEAGIAGRQRLLAMLRFLRRQKGLENCTVTDLAPAASLRESWKIEGEYTITEEDYLNGVRYEDAIAWTYYFIDIHNEDGVKRVFLPPGVFPTIPLRALIPRGVDRMLAAGRIISADRAAFSALRVEASCMAMGQAVGAAAALACQAGIPSRKIPVDAVRKLLRQHNAEVPEPE